MNRADVVAIVAIVVATLAIAVAVLVRRRRRPDLGDVAAGRIAPVYDELEVSLLAPHDVMPEVDDLWREVAFDYLERMWALPAKERAS